MNNIKDFLEYKIRKQEEEASIKVKELRLNILKLEDVKNEMLKCEINYECHNIMFPDYLKEKNINFYNYFKDLVTLRKEYPELRLKETKEIEEKIKIIDNWHDNLAITYTISKDEDRFLLVIHNANQHDIKLYKSSILTHLENNYESLKEKLVVHKVFSADGLLKKDNKIYEFEKIYIGHRSTEVYELHFEDVGMNNQS